MGRIQEALIRRQLRKNLRFDLSVVQDVDPTTGFFTLNMSGASIDRVGVLAQTQVSPGDTMVTVRGGSTDIVMGLGISSFQVG